jgi:hypothetical protein
MEHPPCFPDLASADFYLFPWLKSIMNGGRFWDAIDIIKNVAKSWKGFQKMASRNVPNKLIVAGRSAQLHKQTIL